MSKSLGRFLLVEQGLVAAFFNALINGVIAWWLNRGLQELPFWGAQSVVADFLATAFLMPLIICLIVSPLVARQVGRGQLAALDSARSSAARLYSRFMLVRGLFAGLLGVVVTLPVLLLWSWQGPMMVTLNEFVGIKAVFTGVLGGLITPLIAWWALVDASRSSLLLKEVQRGNS